LKYINLADTGLKASIFGLGTYRLTVENKDHHEIIRSSLNLGINIFDTAANFMAGGSEKLLSRIFTDDNNIERKRIILISKIGLIQGTLLKHLQSQNDLQYNEIVRYNDNCWQSISKEFLADELNRSLNRLAVKYIDFLLIQNPEYYLIDAFKNNIADEQIIRENFYRKLKDAFIYLETAVSEGKISYYGLCTNSLGSGHPFKESIDVNRVFTILEEISTEYLNGNKTHFKCTEIAVNLIEYNENLQELIDILKSENTVVFANRPLNSISNGRLRRIADYSDEILPFSETKVKVIVQAIESLEKKLLEYFSEHQLVYSFNEKESIESLIQFSEVLKRFLGTALDIDQINPIFNRYFYLNLKLVMDKVLELKPNDDVLKKIFLLLERSLQELEIQIKLHCKKVITEDSKQLMKEKNLDNDLLSSTEKALKFVSDLNGVDVVFSGITRDKYLKNVAAISKK
jgi:aryl-alcohol dehydrogenase-like predicted oxidoreductase